jgi:hypothetical protein
MANSGRVNSIANNNCRPWRGKGKRVLLIEIPFNQPEPKGCGELDIIRLPEQRYLAALKQTWGSKPAQSYAT